MNRRFLFWLLPALLSATFWGCSINEKNTSPQHKLLLVSFDGFRYDYPERTETPHFDSLAVQGVRAEGIIPVFPTKTFPNHYSIATGLYPENTGLVANNMYDPEFKEWYRISKREAVENKKWYGGEPIWNTAEKQGLRTGTMFWVGSEAPIQDMHPTYWKRYDGDLSERARIDTVVNWLAGDDNKGVDFATLYFELVDDAGHYHGLYSDSLDAAIQKADSLIGYLKRKLRGENLWDEMNIIVLSDHGMAQLSKDRMIRLDKIIDMEDVERIVWAPVTMITPKKGKSETIYRALKDKESSSHYRIYKKENLPERYHLKENRRVPELVMVADVGYTILDENYEDRFLNSLPSATHGFDNGKKEMLAYFVAKGPAFKKGEEIGKFQNIHVYELLSYLLKIEPAVNDGSLDSVRVMLK